MTLPSVRVCSASILFSTFSIDIGGRTQKTKRAAGMMRRRLMLILYDRIGGGTQEKSVAFTPEASGMI
jgi:hypothetical protein